MEKCLYYTDIFFLLRECRLHGPLFNKVGLEKINHSTLYSFEYQKSIKSEKRK